MQKAAIAPRTELIYRHAPIVRVTHWINVLCLLVLLMSGLQIFNAHSTLYWGSKSEPDRAVLSMRTVQRDDGSYAGLTTIGPWTFNTTGVLGLSGSGEDLESRGFPSWVTLPSYRDLATGRRWHFARSSGGISFLPLPPEPVAEVSRALAPNARLCSYWGY